MPEKMSNEKVRRGWVEVRMEGVGGEVRMEGGWRGEDGGDGWR